jgi:hypothetical protein
VRDRLRGDESGTGGDADRGTGKQETRGKQEKTTDTEEGGGRKGVR